MKKILIIRFSSIGDIILTSPILRCLKNQTDNTIHYLIKEKYRMVIESNPYIDKIHSFNGHNFHIISELKSENYDLIIDLQNSINSWWIKLNLNTLSNTVRKKNWEKFLLIYFGLDYLGDHVVDRYFSCIKNISINNDDKGLDFYLKNKIDVNFNTNQHFIAWSIGGSFSTKKLSAFQIIEVCNNLNENIVLLGGEGEKDLGSSIIKGSNNTKIYNFCGELSLDESAYLIQKSQLVLSNDTGLMHIAASFKKPIISFWGCTKPNLGFSPYMSNKKCVEIIVNPKSRPCSKYGKKCRFQKNGCIKKIASKDIIKAIVDVLN